MAEDKRDQDSLAGAAADDLVTDGQDPSDEAAAASTDPEGAAGGSGESELSVYTQIEMLEEELEKARDQVLRAQADSQNALRRAEQDVEKARKFALERFSGELLPVVDNLERALEAINSDEPALSSITEGVDLTLKSFVDALRKFHIEQLDPLGEPFDPQHHQAMSIIENPDAEPNTVLAVMQKGYTLNGRLVRPAMVMVSKAPTAD